jgi:creatinine amidohydrolase
VLSWENTSYEIAAAQAPLAVLPIGAIEQHSHHLPIGTDWLGASAVARAVAERLDAFLLPALPYGNSQEHQAFSGTIWLRPDTLARVVVDIVNSLVRHGIRRILIINGHGGNWVLKPTVRELNLSRDDVLVLWAGPEVLTRGAASTPELHSGEGETSRMLFLHPNLVALDRAVDTVPEATSEYLDYVGVGGVSPDGAWGRPTKATAEQGRRLFEQAVENVVNYVRTTLAKVEPIRARGQHRRSPTQPPV